MNQCGNCGQRQPRHTAGNCPYDNTDDVIVVNGKLPSKRKKGPGEPTKKKSNKKAKANFGVSIDDVDSWLPSVRRDNGSA